MNKKISSAQRTNKKVARARRGTKTKILARDSGKPRLVVFRSGKHIYSLIAVDHSGGDKVLACCSTIDKELKSNLIGKSKVEQASLVGKLLGKRACDLGLTQVVFDRAGYKYHGRVKSLAEGAREAGLDF